MLVSVVKMESPTLQELTEHGRKMELKGTDLQKFIIDQQTHYRELRAAERSKEKEEREYQLKRERVLGDSMVSAKVPAISIRKGVSFRNRSSTVSILDTS